jgi:hypothetical protein
LAYSKARVTNWGQLKTYFGLLDLEDESDSEQSYSDSDSSQSDARSWLKMKLGYEWVAVELESILYPSHTSFKNICNSPFIILSRNWTRNNTEEREREREKRSGIKKRFIYIYRQKKEKKGKKESNY